MGCRGLRGPCGGSGEDWTGGRGVRLGSRVLEEAGAPCPALGFWSGERSLNGISGPPRWRGGVEAGPRQAEREAHRTQASAASCGVPEETPGSWRGSLELGSPREPAERGAPAAPTGGTRPLPGAWRELPRPGFHDNPGETNKEAQHPPESRKRKAASAARPRECEALVPGRLRPTRLLGDPVPLPLPAGRQPHHRRPSSWVWGKGSQEIAFPSRSFQWSVTEEEEPSCALSHPHLLDRRKFPSGKRSPWQGRAWGCPQRPPNQGASA